MITLNTLKITTLAVATALSLNACKSTSSTQQTAESRVSMAEGNARAEAYLNDAGRKIRMAIANGEMTEEEGRLKYAGIAKRVEKRMAGTKSKTAATDTRARYKEASGKMLKMVEAGEITREQMQTRLDEMKKRMSQSSDATRREASPEDQRARRARYQEAADRMAEMVKAGEITREQMQTRLDEMKKRMSSDNKSKQISKEDYNLASSKMARMVKAGEITREQMQTRLDGMKKRMSQSADGGASDADKRARRARYQEASDKMLKMVEAGEITREQMQTRLDEMRERMRK